MPTLKVSLQPKQATALKASMNTPVFFYGGAKGGGKSHLIRAREVIRRNKYPGTKGLIIRRTHPELRSNHILKFFTEYPETKQWYSKTDKSIYWPNGSITEFSHLHYTDDVYSYQGREYDDIDIDEVTQHEEEVFKILRSSNRRSNPSQRSFITPTIFLTGNPGGPGHAWVKRLFIDKKYAPNENPSDYGFVQAFVTDNPVLLEADPFYLDRLKALPEHLRRAYLEGDWNVHAGMAFSELSHHVHLVEPFELPAETVYFAGYDHGFNHPYSFTLLAVVPDGLVYLTNHITGRLQYPEEIVEKIVSTCSPLIAKTKKKINIHAGQDLWSPQRDGGPAVVEQFRKAGLTQANGFIIHRANTNRVQGVQELRRYFAIRGRENGIPMLSFFKNTQDVFDTCASMQYDTINPEDVIKVDADESNNFNGDDSYDSLRYAIMGRVYPPKTEADSYPEDSGNRILMEHLKQIQARKELGLFN